MSEFQLPRSVEADLRSIIRELSVRKMSDTHVKENIERAMASTLTVKDKSSHDRAVDEVFSALLMCVDAFSVTPNIPVLFLSVSQSLVHSEGVIDNESSFLHVVTLLHKAVVGLKGTPTETPHLRCMQLLSVLQTERFVQYFDCEVVLSLVLSSISVQLCSPSPVVSQAALAGLKQFMIYLRDSPNIHHPYLLVSRGIVALAFPNSVSRDTSHVFKDFSVSRECALDVLLSSGFRGSFWDSDPEFVSLLQLHLLPGIADGLKENHHSSETDFFLKLIILVFSWVKSVHETCPEQVCEIVLLLGSLLGKPHNPVLECFHDAVFARPKILKLCDDTPVSGKQDSLVRESILASVLNALCVEFGGFSTSDKKLLLQCVSHYLDLVVGLGSITTSSLDVVWRSVLSVLVPSFEQAAVLMEKFIRALSLSQLAEARTVTVGAIVGGAISLRVVGLFTIFANGTQQLAVADWSVVMDAFEAKENENTKKFFAQIQKAQPVVVVLVEALMLAADSEKLSQWRLERVAELVEKTDDVPKLWDTIVKKSLEGIRRGLDNTFDPKKSPVDAVLDLLGRLSDSAPIHEETLRLMADFFSFSKTHATAVLVAAVKDSGNRFSEPAWMGIVQTCKRFPSFGLVEVALEEHILPAAAASAFLEILQSLSVSSLTNPQVFKGIALAQKISAQTNVSPFFGALCVDPRPDVRHCAIRTVPSALTLEETLEVVIIVSQRFADSSNSPNSPQRHPQSILVHHSRDTSKKQWSESVVLGLGAVGEILKKSFSQKKSISTQHPLLEGLLRGGLSTPGEIADAAIELFLAICRLVKFNPKMTIIPSILKVEADLVRRTHVDRLSPLLPALLEEKRKSSIPAEFSPALVPLFEAILLAPSVYTNSTIPYMVSPDWNYRKDPEPFSSVVNPEEYFGEHPVLYREDFKSLPVDSYMARTVFPCLDLFGGIFRLEILSLVLNPAEFLFRNSGTLHLALRVISGFTEAVETHPVDSVLVRSFVAMLGTVVLTRKGSVRLAATNVWKLGIQALVRIGLVLDANVLEQKEVLADVLDTLEEYLISSAGAMEIADVVDYSAVFFCVSRKRLCMMHLLDANVVNESLARLVFLLVWDGLLSGGTVGGHPFEKAKMFVLDPFTLEGLIEGEKRHRIELSSEELGVLCAFTRSVFRSPAVMARAIALLTACDNAKLRVNIALQLMDSIACNLITHESVRSAVADLLTTITPDLVSRFEK